MKPLKTRHNGADRTPFAYGEPVHRLLLGHLRLNAWVATIVVLIVLGAPVYSYASVRGIWTGQGGLIKDWPWWWFQFVSSPAALLFLFWMPDGIKRILAGLRTNGVILVPPPQQEGCDDAYAEFINDFDRSYTRPIWVLVCVALSLLNAAGRIIPYFRQFTNWRGLAGPTPDEFMFLYGYFYWFAIYYFWFLIVVKGTIVVVWLARLFRRFDVLVRVLHPDSVGGFSPIGSIVPRVGALVALVGFSMGVIAADAGIHADMSFWEAVVQTNLIGITVVYIALVPAVYYGLVGSAHSAMKEFKDNIGRQISNEFDHQFALAQTSLKLDHRIKPKHMERLVLLGAYHGLTDAFPVWPIATKGIAQFFTVVLAPLIVGVAVVIVQVFLFGN